MRKFIVSYFMNNSVASGFGVNNLLVPADRLPTEKEIFDFMVAEKDRHGLLTLGTVLAVSEISAE